MHRDLRHFDPPLDPGIAPVVAALLDAGIETFESCEGGPGHSFAEPTIRFHGHLSEGFRALAVAMACGFQVTTLRRYWSVLDGEPTGPHWELIIATKKSVSLSSARLE